MPRAFTCKDCGGSFETVSNTGRLPSKCTTCKPKPEVKTKADISPLLLSNTQTVATTRKPTAASIQHQERALKALTMRRDRYTWEAIAQACGYSDRAAAYKAAKAEMARRAVDVSETIDDIRRAELEHLEMLSMEALQVMRKTHFHVSAGMVTHYNDRPMIDDKPTLDAIATLLKVGESRRKLLGLDAATKAEVSTQVQFTIQGIPEGEMP